MSKQIEIQKVEFALANILRSAKFAAAPQMSAFLNYVVKQTLAGNASRIKAYTVAVDALGKPETFDAQNDPSVRVLAKRLRSALDNYYLLNPETETIVEMKAGSYVPKFLLQQGIASSDQKAEENSVPEIQPTRMAVSGGPAPESSNESTLHAGSTVQAAQTNIQVPGAQSANIEHKEAKPESSQTDAASTEAQTVRSAVA